jgi:hypothetical protein
MTELDATQFPATGGDCDFVGGNLLAVPRKVEKVGHRHWKRINVKQLKASMWDEIETLVGLVPDVSPQDAHVPSKEADEGSEGSKSFASVFSGLKRPLNSSSNQFQLCLERLGSIPARASPSPLPLCASSTWPTRSLSPLSEQRT